MKTLLIPLVGLLLVAAACTTEGGPTPTPVVEEDVRGVLAGSVTIGPLCPVEPCADPGDAYSSRALVLERPDGAPIRIPLQADGTFDAAISAGSYTADLEGCEYPSCARALPISVEIVEGQTTPLTINIDTGIRASVAPTPTADPAGFAPAEETFRALLTTADINALVAAPADLTTDIRDFKAMAASVDPAQTTNMDSWYGVFFTAGEGGPGLSFNVIDFDSPSSARAHFGVVTAEGMQGMDAPIADASAHVEVNAQGIGSMLVFLAGDRLVSLHTAQADDQQPLVSLEGIEELGKLVASRL